MRLGPLYSLLAAALISCGVGSRGPRERDLHVQVRLEEGEFLEISETKCNPRVKELRVLDGAGTVIGVAHLNRSGRTDDGKEHYRLKPAPWCWLTFVVAGLPESDVYEVVIGTRTAIYSFAELETGEWSVSIT